MKIKGNISGKKLRKAAKWSNHFNSEICFKLIYGILKSQFKSPTEISKNNGPLGPRFDFVTFLEGDIMVDWIIFVILVAFYQGSFLYLFVRLIYNQW